VFQIINEKERGDRGVGYGGCALRLVAVARGEDAGDASAEDGVVSERWRVGFRFIPLMTRPAGMGKSRTRSSRSPVPYDKYGQGTK
jgi:hypothetical protein